MRGSVRRGLTTTMFYATMAVSILTVAAPQILPCPVPRGVGADGKDKNNKEWNKKVVVEKDE